MADYNSSYTGAQIDAAVGAVASKADDTAVVHDTGNETIGGVKTFSSFPVTPSTVPTTNYQAANKKYIDDKVKTDVPVDAKFTDTIYTHPDTHSADIIVDGSTNKAYTADEKTKLSGIATGATANSTDATLLNRANHTGTQSKSTISDFPTSMTPTAHKSTHATGGGDALTASDIGAAPAYQYSTTDLTAGTSALATGTLYFVYE